MGRTLLVSSTSTRVAQLSRMGLHFDSYVIESCTADLNTNEFGHIIIDTLRPISKNLKQIIRPCLATCRLISKVTDSTERSQEL